MRIAHLTTVDMSLRYLLLPQLEAARAYGESIGISAPGEFVADLERRGIRHISLQASTRGMNLLADLRAAVQLRRILLKERVDVLHTHNPKPGVYGRVIGRLAGVPIIVNTVHGLYATPDSPWLKRLAVYSLEWLASRFSDAELIQNPEDLELLERLHVVPRSRLRLLGNGVDLERFDPEKAQVARDRIRTQLGIGEDKVVVGMVGRLVAEKGIPELIAAAERLDSSYLVLVAGPHDPEKGDAIPADMISRGEEVGMRFLGHRSDVDSLYGAFDIFVLPSHREGFPRAAMEAAASGLPIVATNIRGCRQVVEDEVNGVLVPVGDVDRLTAAIARLGSDPELRKGMGKASAERARQMFDERRVVDVVMSIYRELARRKGLEWETAGGDGETRVRRARPVDAPAMAELHRRLIEGGFLSTLGKGFLTLLYKSLTATGDGAVFLAERDGVGVGFIAGVADTGAFYRRFVRRHALDAALRLVPALLRRGVARRLWETLRYGGKEEGDAAAELLAMAVAPRARGSGVGRSLVAELQCWAADMGLPAMRVVVGEENEAAIRLYQRSGFGEVRSIEVHRGEPSLELMWRR